MQRLCPAGASTVRLTVRVVGTLPRRLHQHRVQRRRDRHVDDALRERAAQRLFDYYGINASGEAGTVVGVGVGRPGLPPVNDTSEFGRSFSDNGTATATVAGVPRHVAAVNIHDIYETYLGLCAGRIALYAADSVSMRPDGNRR